MLVPLDTLLGLLWVVVTKAALFRGLLHINAVRKLVAGHLMRWQQFFLRYFLAPILPVCSTCKPLSVKFPRGSLWAIEYAFDLCFVHPRRQSSSNHLSWPRHLHITYRTLNLTSSLLFIRHRTNQRYWPKLKAQYAILGPYPYKHNPLYWKTFYNLV